MNQGGRVRALDGSDVSGKNGTIEDSDLVTQTAYVRGMAASVPNFASSSSWLKMPMGIDLPPT